MIYQFRPGFTVRAMDAQTVGEELEAIREANAGRLMPDDVLQYAANPKSPLNAAFTWDDSLAAEKYRLDEARNLIRNVLIVSKRGVSQKAYHRVRLVRSETQDSASYYQSSEVLAHSPIEFEAAVQVAQGLLEGIERNLDDLKALAPRSRKSKVSAAKSHVRAAGKAIAV